MASQMRIRGPLDVDALKAAFQYAVDRQEVLRTTFVEREGHPVQVIGPSPEIEMPLVELDPSQDPEPASEAILRRHALEPFDLETGPLVRVWLARVSDHDHRLLRLSHHIVTDWLSWQIFFRDVAREYGAQRQVESLPQAAEGLQYADFAAWERERLRPDGPIYRDQLEWWRQAYGSACPPLTLPFSRPASVSDAPETDALIDLEMEPEDVAALDEIARRAGTSPFMVRLAAFSAQLGLGTGQEVIPLGTYAMNRPPEAQSVFGFFSNPVTLILRFDPKLSFRRWLARVRDVVTEAKAHSEIPYDRLCEELHRGGTPPPEMTAMFSRLGRWPLLESAGIQLEAPRYITRGMPWGFSFSVDPNAERERFAAKFDARIHDPVGVREFVGRYAALVHRVVARPNRRLRRLRY
jgi:hypothetical protein